MKRYLQQVLIPLGLLASMPAFGQNDILRSQIDSLQYLSGDAFDCHAVTWRIIKHGKDAIPFLIDRLDDTTPTTATDKCKPTILQVGDIAYLTLERILHLKITTQITTVAPLQFCIVEYKGYHTRVLEYLQENRKQFKEQARAYYDRKKGHMQWVPLSSDRGLVPFYMYSDPGYRENGIYGRYE